MTSFENIHINQTTQFNDLSSSKHLRTQNEVQANQFIKKNYVTTCFYHNDKEICFFCKHPRCTLPLCESCLPVHRMEHLNRKQIPMENVVTFAQCKRFILDKLKESKMKVTSNQKQFQKQLLHYKQKLIDIIETTIANLKEQLLIQDKQNSILKLKEINQGIEKIQVENSLSDVIKCYETYYKEIQLNEQSGENKDKEITKHSIINYIKFVPDEKNLVQTIERGFLHCKFVKLQPDHIPPKINRDHYLKVQNEFSRYERTPIQKLQKFISNSLYKNANSTEKKENSINKIEEVPIQSFNIIQVKRQLRKSIFDQKQNNPTVRKSLSFSNLSKAEIKNTKNLQRQSLFSDVKKYKIDNSGEIVLGKRKNIYTQNLSFGSEKSSESSFIKRSNSNSSLRQNQKGLTLTRHKPGVSDHYLMKQRESIDKMKQRLLNVTQNDEASFERNSSSDWKRVVTLSNSQASLRHTSRQRPNIYQLKAQPNKNKQIEFMNQGNLTSDVLNPMEMRKLLMKKRNDRKEEANPVEEIQKEYQEKLLRLYS